MAKKQNPAGKGTPTGPQLADSVKESAQQIWLAGLGAFAKAQEEGSKVFDALVKEGVAIQRKTQAAAEEKLTEASHKMTSMATDFSAKATGQWDKLETIFEERVAKALNRLGVPSAKDVAALAARIDELSKAVEELSGQAAAKPKAAAGSAAKAATQRTAPKSAPKQPAAY